jgi:TRAP transporter TAXI family solute receptor
MMMKVNKIFILVIMIFLTFGQAYCQMIMLSGPEKGTYSRFVNDMAMVLGEKNGIKILNRTTGGSSNNFKEITNPSSAYKIGLIQSDYLSQMEAEDKLNNTHKTDSLKVVLQLAPEEIHIVAKKSSGLNKLQDLDKKKVAIGNEDQGSLATGKIMKERSKVNWITSYVSFDQMLKQLSSGIIDAFLLVGSAPVNIIDIDPRIMIDGGTLVEVDDLNGWAKYYENDTIYRSDYKWLDRDIPTFGVRTLLIVNNSKLTSADRQTVAAIKSGIIQNLDLLRQQGHPKWKKVIIPDETGGVIEKNMTASKDSEAVTSNNREGITYRIQIYSRNYQKNDNQVIINGETYNTYVYSHLGAFRYTIGEFNSLSSAVELQNLCRESGYHEAFVAAFKNNLRSNDPDLFK